LIDLYGEYELGTSEVASLRNFSEYPNQGLTLSEKNNGKRGLAHKSKGNLKATSGEIFLQYQGGGECQRGVAGAIRERGKPWAKRLVKKKRKKSQKVLKENDCGINGPFFSSGISQGFLKQMVGKKADRRGRVNDWIACLHSARDIAATQGGSKGA